MAQAVSTPRTAPVPLPAANRWSGHDGIHRHRCTGGRGRHRRLFLLGQSVRGATAGIALELAGEKADEGIAAAKGASEKALNAAKAKATLNNYNSNNH